VTSANVPNSGLTFVDNSQGCSAAVAELSGLLDVALDQFDIEGETSDQLQLQLKRLYDEAAKYSNSHLGDDGKLEQWQCTRHEAEIVSIAFACAAGVYQPDLDPSVPGFTFEKESHIAPSIGGTVKATDIFIVKDSSPQTKTNPLLPVMVVAIRGTASRVDRIVNLNGESRLVTTGDWKIRAHGGFLNGAESLTPSVAQKIAQEAKKNAVKHVLFTGHSAGGAVASLLFMNFLSRAISDYPSMKFSVVSFGAPPITQPDMNPTIMASDSSFARNCGLVLSMINEYDLVPRADQAYIRSLVDLYRSIYSLPPIPDDTAKESSTNFVIPRLSFESRSDDTEKRIQKVWSLPKPVYWHIGKLVVLKVKLANKKETEDDEWILNASVVTPQNFARLLFCNVDIHKRLRYQERVDMLLEGRFNGRTTWQTVD